MNWNDPTGLTGLTSLIGHNGHIDHVERINEESSDDESIVGGSSDNEIIIRGSSDNTNTWFTIKTLLTEGRSLKYVFDDLRITHGTNTISSELLEIVVGKTPLIDDQMVNDIRRSACSLIEIILVNPVFENTGGLHQVPSLISGLRVIFEITFKISSEVGDAASHLFGVMITHIGDNDRFCNELRNLSQYLRCPESYNIKFTLIALNSLLSDQFEVKRYFSLVNDSDSSSGDDAINHIVFETNELLKKPDVESEIKILCRTLLSQIGYTKFCAIVERIEDFVRTTHESVDSKNIDASQGISKVYHMLVTVHTKAVTPYFDIIFNDALKLSESRQFEIVNDICILWRGLASSGLSKEFVLRMSECVLSILKHLNDVDNSQWPIEQKYPEAYSPIERSSSYFADVVSVQGVIRKCLTDLAVCYPSELTAILFPQLKKLFKLYNCKAGIQALSAVAVAAIKDNRIVEFLPPGFRYFIEYFMEEMKNEDVQLRLAAYLAISKLSAVIFQWRRSASENSEALFSELLAFLFSRFYEDNAWCVRRAICGVILDFIETSEESDVFFTSSLLSITGTLLISFPERLRSDWDISFELISASLEFLGKKCTVPFKPLFDGIETVACSDFVLTPAFFRYVKHTVEFYGLYDSIYINMTLIKCMGIASTLMEMKDQQLVTYRDDYSIALLELFAIAAEEATILDVGIEILNFLMWHFYKPQTASVQKAANGLMAVALDKYHVDLLQYTHLILQRVVESLLLDVDELQETSVTIFDLVENKWPGSVNNFIKENLLKYGQFEEKTVKFVGSIALLVPEKVTSVMHPNFYCQCVDKLRDLGYFPERNSILIGIFKSFLHMLTKFDVNILEIYLPDIEHTLRLIFQYYGPTSELKKLFEEIKSASLVLLNIEDEDEDEDALEQYLFGDGGNLSHTHL